MKLWRKSKQESQTDQDIIERDSMIDATLRAHSEQLRNLSRQLAELRKASHDHCLECGVMTPRYGMTLCGTTDCAQKAMA